MTPPSMEPVGYLHPKFLRNGTWSGTVTRMLDGQGEGHDTPIYSAAQLEAATEAARKEAVDAERERVCCYAQGRIDGANDTPWLDAKTARLIEREMGFLIQRLAPTDEALGEATEEGASRL